MRLLMALLLVVGHFSVFHVAVERNFTTTLALGIVCVLTIGIVFLYGFFLEKLSKKQLAQFSKIGDV